MLIFLKLGGSLITDKRVPEAARHDVIERLANEVAAARSANSNLKLIIGNGAGSFAHGPAKKYGTRDGAKTSEEWYGFARTADAAARLNRLVASALLKANVPAWTVQPSAGLRCVDGKIVDGPVETIALALRNGLVPLVHGDVALDDVRGSTIASTEEIFDLLAERLSGHLPPGEEWAMKGWVLAGEVGGIYSADPLLESDAERFDLITPAILSDIEHGLGKSHGVDVTGGMMAKVAQSFSVIERYPALEILVCSGLTEGTVTSALSFFDNLPKDWVGTKLRGTVC